MPLFFNLKYVLDCNINTSFHLLKKKSRLTGPHIHLHHFSRGRTYAFALSKNIKWNNFCKCSNVDCKPTLVLVTFAKYQSPRCIFTVFRSKQPQLLIELVKKKSVSISPQQTSNWSEPLHKVLVFKHIQ